MKPSLVVQMSRAVGISLLVGLIVGVSLSPAHADQGGIPAQVAALREDVQTLQQQVRQLIENARNQNNVITQLTAVVNAQRVLLGCMSKNDNEVFFTGCNVHIVSGSGATYGGVNGLGNLIIGYNEDATDVGYAEPSIKTGSHNLVVGPGHSYASYGGLVAGSANRVTGPSASVSGGLRNTAAGDSSSVCGGSFNTAAIQGATVSGGQSNVASGVFSSVFGGLDNKTQGQVAVVVGGRDNTANGLAATVSGGQGNDAGGDYSSASGGIANHASGSWSSVSGGAFNAATGERSSVTGGVSNHAGGTWSSVSGGRENIASGAASSVSGGQNRRALNDYNWAAGALFQSE